MAPLARRIGGSPIDWVIKCRSGRRTRERTKQGGLTYQDNHLSYDALIQLREVSDARA